MSWNGKTICELRRRLGWTTADLARRLGCAVEEINGWEGSQSTPSKDYSHQLEYLRQHMDGVAEQLKEQPLADSLMRERGLGQITRDELRGFDDN